MLGSATAESYARSLPVVLADPGIDAAIACSSRRGRRGGGRRTGDLDGRAASDGTKPVLASILAAAGTPQTLRDATSVPSFAYPEAAAGALGRAAARVQRWLRRSAGRVPDLEGINAGRTEEVVRRALKTGESVWLGPSANPEPPQ